MILSYYMLITNCFSIYEVILGIQNVFVSIDVYWDSCGRLVKALGLKLKRSWDQKTVSVSTVLYSPLGVGDGVDALEAILSVHDVDAEVFLTAVL